MQEFLQEIPESCRNFMIITDENDVERHNTMLADIDSYISAKKTIIAGILQTREQQRNAYPKIYTQSAHMRLASTFYITQLFEDEKAKYEISEFEKGIKIASKVRKLIEENPNIGFHTHTWAKYFALNCKKNVQYTNTVQLRNHFKKRLEKYVSKISTSDVILQIRDSIITATKEYNENLNFIPPSPLDQSITEYIERNSEVKINILPRVQFVGNPSIRVEEKIEIINQFSAYLFDLINVSGSYTQIAVYFSVLRYIFDSLYTLGNELSQYYSENCEFLKKCQAFSNKRLRDLNLDPELMKGYIPGLPVSSFFKSKQLSIFDNFSYLTNPFDLVYTINCVVEKLGQLYGKEGAFLAFDDILTLFIGIIAVNPPPNGYSIKVFLEKWDSFQTSDVFPMMKNYYIAAVNYLMDMDINASEDEKQGHRSFIE